MSLRLISVSISDDDLAAVLGCAEAHGATGVRVHVETQKSGRATVEMLAGAGHRQELLDAMQSALTTRDDWRISLLPVETTIPLPEAEEEEPEDDPRAKRIGGLSREEIYDDVWPQAQIGRTYIVFVVLSAVVAAFGMIEDNVAVVIGAMVIAPLLGPVLAFSVGVALGEDSLMVQAAVSAAVGILLAILLGLGIGLLWPIGEISSELMSRSQIGYDAVAIALASGAAAALSLVTGISSALVGVMVAVALLPPATAVGILLGMARPDLAGGALLMLGVNIVCVNLAAQAVMLSRGITPRAWFDKQAARRGSLVNASIWLALLAALVALMWMRTVAAG